MTSSRRTTLAGAGVALSLLLTACSTGPTGSGGAGADEAAGSAGGEASGQFPVTIEHAFGETTIESDPQRVATVGWVDHDTMAALGEVPVGATEINWGGNEQGSTDWFDEAVEGLGADPSDITRYDESAGITVDKIAALEPDLILGTNSGMTQEEFDRLSKIAPVIAYPEQAWATPWRETVEMVGEAIGRSGAAQATIEDIDGQIEQAKADHPAMVGASFAWIYVSPTDLSTVTVYSSSDLRPQMMREFGMVDADIVTEISEGNDSYSGNVSAEQADTIGADVLAFYLETDDHEEKVLEDPLLGQIPALQDGAYVASADNTLTLPLSSPSALSIPVAIERFVPLVGQAAQQAR